MYPYSISGSMGLAVLGTNTLTLTAASTFTGPTTVSGGTLDLDNGLALQNSTLIAPPTGSLVFDPGVAGPAPSRSATWVVQGTSACKILRAALL